MKVSFRLFLCVLYICTSLLNFHVSCLFVFLFYSSTYVFLLLPQVRSRLPWTSQFESISIQNVWTGKKFSPNFVYCVSINDFLAAVSVFYISLLKILLLHSLGFDTLPRQFSANVCSSLILRLFRSKVMAGQFLNAIPKNCLQPINQILRRHISACRVISIISSSVAAVF
jgi:hypothetical protein